MIVSADNKYFKKYKSLLNKKGISQHKACLIIGRKIVPEYINSSNVLACIATESNKNQLKQPPPATITLFSKALFNQLDVCGSNHPLLVYKTPEIPKSESLPPPKGLEVMTAMGEPNNLGALIRSARAFNAKQVILLQEACHPFLPKVIKASSGEVLKSPLVHGPSITNLTESTFYCLDKSGSPIGNFKWPLDFRFLAGEEGPGFPENIQPLDYLSIPMNTEVESLNASHACALTLYSYYSNLNKDHK